MKSTETKGTRMRSEADTEAEGLEGTSRECLATSLDQWQCVPFITCMGKPDREP